MNQKNRVCPNVPIHHIQILTGTPYPVPHESDHRWIRRTSTSPKVGTESSKR